VKNFVPLTCGQCTGGQGLDFEFTMAFQPIVELSSGEVFAQEALVRGMHGESAASILARVNDDNRYRFDQACRVTAIRLAAQLKVETFLSINFLPHAIYRPESCIRTTLEAAALYNFPINRVIFEVTESEQVDPATLRAIIQYYRSQGFLTAIDDFGAGYAGLGLLCDFESSLVKLDMHLIRNIDRDARRRVIVKRLVQVCQELNTTVIGEGIETREELAVLRDFGVDLVQGYYFAKPAFQSLAVVPPERFERH
jgi:EAL domain-containing protein (putative c-di-GMP-specific phosphodiesterase class I)